MVFFFEFLLEMNCKRKDLTLKEKIDVLEYATANKCTQLELSKKFQISQAQVSKLLKNKEKILNAIKRNANPNLKRQRSGKEAAIEDALLRWFYEVQALNAPINGIILSQKAEDIARELNISNFKVTNGWLCRWKKRNQISFKRNHVEIYDAAVDMMDKSLDNVSPYSPHIIQNYFVKCKFLTDSLNNNATENYSELPPETVIDETVSKFPNFDNDLESSDEISNCELSKEEMRDNDDYHADPDEKCLVNKSPSPGEVTNACDIIRQFLESKPNVDLDIFYKLENQVTNLLQYEKKQ